MALVATADLVAEAAARGAGVADFNVVTLEHAEAILAGARGAGLAVVLQVSENAVRFHGGQLGPIAAAAAGAAAGVACSLHVDHVESVALLERAPDHGFSSAMFDASALPFADNRGRDPRGGTVRARARDVGGERARQGGRQGEYGSGCLSVWGAFSRLSL